MKISDLKKVLTALNKEELSEIIIDLYKSNKAVKDFLNYHLNISRHCKVNLVNIRPDAESNIFNKLTLNIRSKYFKLVQSGARGLLYNPDHKSIVTLATNSLDGGGIHPFLNGKHFDKASYTLNISI